jgi:peptidoglycan DL-endopeptidase CwlO
VHTPASIYQKVSHRGLRRRVLALGGCAVAAGLLAGAAVNAGASSQPTVAQVQHQITKLDNKAQRLGQQYDAVQQQLKAADQRLKLIDGQVSRYTRQFDARRTEVGRIAVTDYENGTVNSSIGLLTSGDPQQILNQASILSELSNSNAAQIDQLISAARQLKDTQNAARRTHAGILKLWSGLAKRKAALNKLIAKEKALLAQLTPAQKTGLGPGGGGTGGIKYKGPTSTQAEKAVAFAYDQLGCTYFYGGTGPCHDPGFDCSGLTMESWAHAGVSIPRTSYEQMSELPAVALPSGDVTKYLEPGDILGFIGNGHVGIYVGNGMLIDAPQPGQNVERVALSGWFLQNLDGAVRP